MAKMFNTTAVCIPEQHYLVDINDRLKEIKALVDEGKYFTVNRARQYGKTTTLRALSRYLQNDYYVIFLDFQMLDDAKFQNGNIFALSFAGSFLRLLKRNRPEPNDRLLYTMEHLQKSIDNQRVSFTLKELFEDLSDICAECDKGIVLMIDEVDSATNHQVFLDFLAQLRAYYIDRDVQPTFRSVILAGVYDVRNMKRKFRSDGNYKENSPWNIAADFLVDMSFSPDDIAGMQREYEADCHTGMDIEQMAGLLSDYTSGYPYLVSRLCKFMDERVVGSKDFRIRAVHGQKLVFWKP